MPEIILEKLTRWIHEIPLEVFFEAARSRPPGLGKNPIFLGLQKDMRALVPVDGSTWVHDIDVLIEPHQTTHQGQQWHAHPEWTAIFYVSPGEPVVPLRIRSRDEVTEIIPEPGDCVIMPPDLEHKVADSHSDVIRLSFAMLVQVPGRESRYAS